MSCFQHLLGIFCALTVALGLAGTAQADAPLPVPKPAMAGVEPAAAKVAPASRPAKAPATPITATPPSGISGWLAVDLDSGEVIDASHEDVAFVPASVAKLPTAAFALHALGADH